MSKALLGGAAFALSLALVGLSQGDLSAIPPGLVKIYTSQDVLISDYIAIGGIGAAFLNAAAVTLFTLLLMWLCKEPTNGYTCVAIGLMAGFALFGKNLFNILPILAGTWLYAKLKREPFSRYLTIGLLATSLAPAVSFLALGDGWDNIPLALVVGIALGFFLPAVSSYTYRIQNGMNLYNMGFACGLLAMILVPLLSSRGRAPHATLHWGSGFNLHLGIYLTLLCIILILVGLFAAQMPPREVLSRYRKLLSTTGRAPSDYLRSFGGGTMLLNTGINGLIGVCYILLIGGDLNGPTLGGIFTIMGFSAFGKHARNIIPVMLGVVLGGFFMRWSIADPSIQLAGLFCTTLAPIAGCFGWPAGLLAGFLHSSMVLHAGTPVEGINLYNNGFSGGLLAIVLFPILVSLLHHRRPVIFNEDYLSAMEQTVDYSIPEE